MEQSKRHGKSPFSKKEEEVLNFWKKNKIFKRSIEARPHDAPFVFYDGPPFATGLPHYGHILSSVVKDLFPRYQTMKGRSVRRRWGWDCHGLPIENLVEKKLDISNKKEIERFGVARFNQAAKEMVLAYAKNWKTTVERIGRWVDFDNSYKTMDTTYMESIWWALSELWRKGLIYEGRKVLLYCPRCETPVSNAEVAMDNSYRDVAEDSITIKLKIKNSKSKGLPGNTSFLAWTTTPWTLPGNVALAVGADIGYVLVEDLKKKGNFLIVAEALLSKVISDKPRVIKSYKGRDFSGWEYEPPYRIKAVAASGKRAWYVSEADFVSTDEGTGIVHIAVIYGEEDFNLGKKIDLPEVPLLDPGGRFNDNAPDFIRGLEFKDSQESIIGDLEERGLIFARRKHRHSYPFCWRCESPLIYNAVSAWFVDIQSQKERIIALNEKINWFPSHLKHKRFLNILKSAPDWNISRSRYFATPLPFFRCEECSRTECVGSIFELSKRSVNFSQVYPKLANKINERESSKGSGGDFIISNDDPIDLHRPDIDKVKLRCRCGATMKRVKEVVDCWIESAAMPFAEWHYPFENKKVFRDRFPGHFIAEYIAQTRTWFYYTHVLAVLLFDDIGFENVVATGTILNERGEKLSKSKQNFADPAQIIAKYGADALRFYLMSCPVMQSDDLFFSEKDLRDIYNKVINTFYNVASFLRTHSAGSREKPGRESLPVAPGILDRWVLSRLESTLSKVTYCLDRYDTVRAGRAIKEFISDLSTWWLRRSRKRFQGKERDVAFAVLRHTIERSCRMMAPFTPFMAEAVWLDIRRDGEPESIHLHDWPDLQDDLIDKGVEEDTRLARRIVEVGHSLRAKAGIKVRQPLKNIYFSGDLDMVSADKGAAWREMILDELNVLNFKSKDKINSPLEGRAGSVRVLLDVRIDKHLAELGALRDVVRAVQKARKERGFLPDRTVKLYYFAENPAAKSFLRKYKEKICSQANLREMVARGKGDKSAHEVGTKYGPIYLDMLS